MMGSVELLDKLHKLSATIHGGSQNGIDVSSLCEEMSILICADTYIVDADGTILARKILAEADSDFSTPDNYLGPTLNKRLLEVLSTRENILPAFLGIESRFNDSYAAVVPIIAYDKRLGTIFLCSKKDRYDIDDIIICEHCADVLGIEMANYSLRKQSDDERKVTEVKSALLSLSHSELEAVKAVFAELKGFEGILVTSRVADHTGISRPVIINALRKFESAGIISSKSAGMKGTYIRVLNNRVYDLLKNC